jgi:dGTP triphosphohydrolase
VAYANKFAKVVKEISESRGLSREDYLVMNWADDVNYMFTNIEDAERTIILLKEIAVELKLPFSKAKCKLVGMYPKKYPQRLKQKIGVEVEELVTVSKEAKILGITWS